MYRYLAALLLFPASLRVYGTPRAWLKALSAGPVFFFSGVVRNGPGLVLPSPSRWRNLLMYWPMKAGIHLVRSRSIGATLRKARQRLRRGGSLPAAAPMYSVPAVPEAHTAESVIRLLGESDIGVVSFDIFDTLLERPVIRPRDIFHLVAAAVDRPLGVDFVRMRWTAEEETGLINARLDDIYAHMRKKFGLDEATTEALRAEELRCEELLLAPRADMRACYDEAVRLGKRIIAVSDMYIPGEILHGILQRKGYDRIEAVYVSCDYGKRKSEGSLYGTVLEAEGIEASALLHVGDNYDSDCRQALACGITALYCPPPLARRLEAEPALAALLDAAARKDPFWSLLLGFGLQRLCSGQDAPSRIGALPDAGSFAAVTTAPLLTGYCLALAGDASLRRDYSRIHFASRDGYLPHKVYTAVARHVPEALPAVYFQAGRRAYYPFLYDSFYSYAESLPPAANENYSLRDFIAAHFAGSSLPHVLEAGLSDEEMALPFFAERTRCLTLLRRFDGEIAAFMEEKRSRARRYYQTVFPSERRHLVFDLGYSGSVGQALGAATGGIVDKLYFWGTPDNEQRDARLGSRTRLFMQTTEEAPYNLLLEELFSPCAGGVVDFDAQAQPVFEPLTPDAEFTAELDAMQDVCLEFAEAFCRRCGPYAAFVHPACGDAFVDVCRYLLVDSPCRNGRLLRHILFPDPLHHSGVPSLEAKMERFLPQASVFSGTGFADPRRRLTPAPVCGEAPRLGVHVHVHNPALLDEMSRYLRDFPVPLDVFVTLTDGRAAEAARRLFGPACIARVRRTQIIVVPNRGRDVAPWVLSMRPYQDDYDLFCHVHAKESAHFDFGVGWRRYLLENLLRPEAVSGMLNLFAQQPRLGCLFPPAFPPLAAFMTSHGIPPAGLRGELDDACVLLRRMGFRGEICRTELFFSMGTMLWYRPHALRQLFTMDLALEEFAAEPIGVEGTIAHAMERLPALIAERNGYVAGTFAVRTC